MKKHKKNIILVLKALFPCFLLIAFAFLIRFYEPGFFSGLFSSKEKEGITKTEAAAYSSFSGEYALSEIGSGNVVTPQQYGALADGTHDDAPALQKALESGKPVVLISDLYLFSGVSVWDYDVSLNGNGYVLYCDGGGLAVCASLNRDSASDAAVIMEKEPFYDTYHKGYVSYQGSNPLGLTLEDYTVDYFNEHHAYISNLIILARNCDGLCGLELKRMCKSVVNNVSSICEKGFDGEVGILIHDCYQTRVENCYAQNWTGTTTSDRGYGIEAFGNGITISGCSAYGNKHDICICSGRDIISNDITVENCRVGCNDNAGEYRSDGSEEYQARFDIHAAGERVTVNDLHIAVEDADPGTILAAIRVPEAEINRLDIEADDGYLVFAELADTIYFTDLQMPDVDLYGGYTEEEAVNEIHITNGAIKGMDRLGPDTKVYLENVTVEDEINEEYQIIQWPADSEE